MGPSYMHILVVVLLVATVGLLGALVTRQQRRKRYLHGNPQSWQRWADQGYELTLMEDTTDPMATQH